MEYLDTVILNNTIEQWGLAICIMVGAYLVLFASLRFTASRLGKLAARTETKVDDLIVDLLRSTRWYVILVWAAWFAAQWLQADPAWSEFVPKAVVLLTLLQVGFWGNHVIGFWIGRVMEERLATDAASATTMAGVRFVARLTLLTVLLLVALDNLGVDITAAVTGLGIGGIAVALALQNILGDLFASLSIILDKPFQIGDFIIVEEYLGSVEHIGLKTTRIRSLSGEQIIFSNTDLLRSRIRNYKRMAERRILFTIGVTYQTPAEKVSAISGMLKEIIVKHKKARYDRAHFKGYGESALQYEIVYYVLSSDYNEYMDIQQEINLEIYSRFAEHGIEFAYPTRTLFVKQEKQPTG